MNSKKSKGKGRGEKGGSIRKRKKEKKGEKRGARGARAQYSKGAFLIREKKRRGSEKKKKLKRAWAIDFAEKKPRLRKRIRLGVGQGRVRRCQFSAGVGKWLKKKPQKKGGAPEKLSKKRKRGLLGPGHREERETRSPIAKL